MIDRVMTAIDDAFGPYGIESFLESLSLLGKRVSSIQETSPELTHCLSGGVFVVDTPTISFWDVYQALGADERSRVDAYYVQKVQSVPLRLRQKYPKAFRM